MDSLHTGIRTAPQIQYPRSEIFVSPGLYPSNAVLNPFQYGAVAGGTAALSTVIHRPIYNLKHFSFLNLTPSHLTVREKHARFEWQIRNTKWFEYPLSWPEHYFTLFFPVWSNAVLHLGIERLLGRDKESERTMRAIDERWAHKHTKVGYIVPVYHTHSRWSWAVDGFASGALTGAIYTMLRHPYDVLRAAVNAPDAPRKFAGVGDVFMTIVKHKPSNALELYKGFGVAAVANVARYSSMFGTYHMWKWELGSGYHWIWFWCCAHVSASLGIILHYPWEQLRFRVIKANSKSRFSKIGAADVMAELRRTVGMTVLMENFMLQRPYFLACGPATMITLFDIYSRETWAATTKRKMPASASAASSSSSGTSSESPTPAAEKSA